MAHILRLTIKKSMAVLVFLFLLTGNSYAKAQWEKFAETGATYVKGDLFDLGIEKLTISIDIYPNYDAYLYRGLAYTGKQLYDKAISDFSEAIAIDPNDVAAYSGRGNAYALKGWYPQAFSDLNEAIKMKPDDGRAYLYRAKIYYGLKEYKMAWEDLKTARMLGQPVDDETMEAYQKKALENSGKSKSKR